ncbi:hypothetical protein [Clostridium sp. C2-6-12]|uniref:toxin-antitoxin system YwqK family antitoxin n=1 Tax=Clostridium sp. C2-6-12 TaxID=2698832 RepID=UPI001368041A|nr:hypothetical protein [Clostridium sp. C2-6-12]
MKKASIFLAIFISVILLNFIGCQNKVDSNKLYDKNGKLRYEGELKDGKPNGKGIAYDKGVLFFEGNFKNGEPDLNGYTKTYWDNGKLMFDGYYKDGKRIEGLVYKEDGSLDGYLPYAPITIIGEWVGTDVNTNKEIFYSVKFLDNGTITDNNDKVLGTYSIDQDTIKLNNKSENYTINGTLSFYTKNKFTISSNTQGTILFIRKGTDGYNK